MEQNDKSILRAYDYAKGVNDAIMYLHDLVDILADGFRATGFDAKRQAESTMYIIERYLEELLTQDVQELVVLLQSMQGQEISE